MGDDQPIRSAAERLVEVLAAIDEIESQRSEVDPFDFQVRIDLKEALRELEVEAARLRAQAQKPTLEQAREELREVERRLAEADKARIDVVKQAGGGSTGGDFGFATDAFLLNRKIDEAQGRGQLLERVRYLRDLIAEGE